MPKTNISTIYRGNLSRQFFFSGIFGLFLITCKETNGKLKKNVSIKIPTTRSYDLLQGSNVCRDHPSTPSTRKSVYKPN